MALPLNPNATNPYQPLPFGTVGVTDLRNSRLVRDGVLPKS